MELMMNEQIQKMQPDMAALSGPALRTFFNIAEAWELGAEEQRKLLGGMPPATFYRYRKNTDAAPLSRDTLERISYILGIYKALQILLPDQAADKWIKKPNAAPIFGGQRAIDRMLAGNVADLYQVRQYLDGERGGW